MGSKGTQSSYEVTHCYKYKYYLKGRSALNDLRRLQLPQPVDEVEVLASKSCSTVQVIAKKSPEEEYNNIQLIRLGYRVVTELLVGESFAAHVNTLQPLGLRQHRDCVG